MDHLHAVLERLGRVRVTSSGSRATNWEACCPAHNDRTPSLAVSLGSDGQVLLYCHAGCDAEDVVRALGLEWADLYPEHLRKKPHAAGDRGAPQEVEAEYCYRDEDGQVLFRVVRLPEGRSGKKRFIQQHPDGQGGWENGIRGVRRVLYRLPEVKRAVRDGTPILYVEGEKDVETALHLAGVSPVPFEPTTSPMGAGKWLTSYVRDLDGAIVWIIPDQDEPGHAHAQHVAASLKGVAKAVKLVELPGLDAHGDLTDWVVRGHDALEFVQIVSETPYVFRRTEALADDDRTCLATVRPGQSLASPSDPAAESDDAVFRATLEALGGGRNSGGDGGATTRRSQDVPRDTHQSRAPTERPQASTESRHDRSKSGKNGVERKSAAPCRRAVRNQAAVLHGLLSEHGVVAYLDQWGAPCVEVDPVGDACSQRRHIYALDDRAFVVYLARLFHQAKGCPVSTSAIHAVKLLLESEARARTERRAVFRRVAFADGMIYLDLGQDDHPVVEIGSYGWTLTASAPVAFMRSNGMAPLPRPVRGGSLELVRACLQLVQGSAWTVVRAWVLASLLPFSHVPPLLIGDAGALRTSALALRLAYLLDPWCVPPAQVAARARRQARDHERFIRLVDLTGGFSDHLALFNAIGQGFGDTAGGRFIVTERPGVAISDDVRIRCLAVTPSWERTGALRAPLRGHVGSFLESVHAGMLGAVLDAAVEALRGYSQVDVSDVYRDTHLEPFIRWVTAAENALGGPAPPLVTVLKHTRRHAWWHRHVRRRYFRVGS